jgi:hypothetical protein
MHVGEGVEELAIVGLLVRNEEERLHRQKILYRTYYGRRDLIRTGLGFGSECC